MLGTSFTIFTDENPVYFEKVLEYYKEKINEVKKSAPTADALKTAIIAGILLSDEVLKKEDAQLTLLTEELIKQLDECLKTTPG
ncbi:MAG TPA: cell division protein ZapA [Spirochaetales bacterium]|nr:cell division protein ZapA [Spirochaetales bacterium]